MWPPFYLVAIISEEKDKASKEYFENLISGKNNPSKSSNTNQAPQKLSPIEEIFHTYMKKSLLNYEEYYQVINKSLLSLTFLET